jgi:glyoxylase-like metal-dependent hydrolase (beta-lactamase superfamily II)
MTQIIPGENGLFITDVEVPRRGFQVRGAVLVGSKRVILWDTLTHPRDMQALVSLYAGKLLTVVYSHADWDHIGGTAALPYNEVIAHSAAAERFGKDVPETLKKLRLEHPSEWEGVRLIPPTLTFNRQMNLDMGGQTLELHALPGHTPDSIVGFLPESGVLLAGDTLQDPHPLVKDSAAIPHWVEQLTAWAADPRLKVVIPAHGVMGGKELIEKSIAWLERVSVPQP